MTDSENPVLELQLSNHERLSALNQQGVSLDLIKLRVDKVTDFLFAALEQIGATPALRDAFDLDWEQTIAEILDEAESQIARRILTDGIRGG